MPIPKHVAASLVLITCTHIPGAAADQGGDDQRGAAAEPWQQRIEALAGSLASAVFFRTDSVDIDAESLTRMRLLGQAVRDLPALHVFLDAHSDRRGSNAHNRRLSRARADVIARVFLAAGVPAERVHGNAWGETRAQASPDDTEGLIFDRRVDIAVMSAPAFDAPSSGRPRAPRRGASRVVLAGAVLPRPVSGPGHFLCPPDRN